MGQVSSVLRRATGGYIHWCPACEETHLLPDGWSFNGNLESPTFTPSFRHGGFKKVIVDGKWVADWWVRDVNGLPIPSVCHYILTSGILNFCGDCTHAFAGRVVPLPKLSEGLTDD